MKKILLIVVLLAIVYFIGTTISNAIEGRNQSAQALQNNSLNGVQVTLPSNKLRVIQGKTQVAVVGDFKIRSNQKTNMTVLPVKILKDGQPFSVNISETRLNSALLEKRFSWIPTKRYVGTVFEIKKGNNMYRMQWTINKSALPPGSYQFAFGDYHVSQSATTSTTSIASPFPPIWSKAVMITPPITTSIDNGDYKLVSYNGNVFTSTNTPLLAFRNGRVRIKICNLMEGSYSVNNTTLNISGLVGTEMACSNNYLNQLEQRFGSLVNAGFKMTISGDYLTLTTNRNVHTFVFIKYIPTPLTINSTSTATTTSTTTRVYPCNFVGPLEPGAVRDCPGGL